MSIKSRFSRVLLFSILAAVVGLIAVYHELIGYGLLQAKGQFTIIWNARPAEELLADPAFPDSLKLKLKFIEEVRKFAIDSIGLKDTENYKSVYDQKGEELMWVVTACEPFRLKAKEWKFPIVGVMPYKGFFNKQKAFALYEELSKEGWDASIRNPGGWSTLGWFTDPILSKMLERSEGDLANLIIHEMVHATIFVKDSVDFNENLASFIGDRGTEKFLQSKYGLQSDEYFNYVQEDKDFVKYIDHMIRGTEKLDSLYHTMRETDPVEKKKELKQKMIEAIVVSMDTLSLKLTDKPSARFKERLPNNSYFMNIKRYQSKQDIFWEEFNNQFNGDLRKYVRSLSKSYPFL